MRNRQGLPVPGRGSQVPGEHLIGEAIGNTGAFDWIDARFRREPAPSEC